MSNLRLVLIAVALFGGAFVSVSLASKGVPVTATRAVAAKPHAPATIVEESIKQPPAIVPVLQQSAASEPAARPKSIAPVERNQLALTAIQAADSYARSPCDMAARAAFVVAASTYLRAKAGEPEATSPPDMRARQAISVAFDAGGLSRDEFPAETEIPGPMASKPRPRLSCINSADLRP